MKTILFVGLTILSQSFLAGCANNESTPADENTGGTGGSSAMTGGSSNTGGRSSSTGGSSSDTGGSNSDTGGSSSDTGDCTTAAGGADADAKTDPHGFKIRLPRSRQITCGGAKETLEDQDWICNFDHGEIHGYVYIQSTPVSWIKIMGVIPSFTSLAQISIDGQVQSLEGAKYDWGGNHHNDMLSFGYAGNGYNYYHSSFGFGWRSCNNMDCLQVSVGATGTVTEDGCTKDRTLPQVCSKINADGTYEDLSKDTFAKCLGDPNL
jgi:hypothetical protein